MHILVVDDDPLAGEMIAAVLESEGHKVVQAADAVAGMEQLNEHQGIELIISDMNMPLVSGVEFFQELRAQGLELPFILLTGDDPEGARAREPRIDACIVKDFSLDESLPAVLARVMAARG